MNVAFLPRREVEPEAWDAVVNGSDDGWVFALNGWQDLILAVKEWGLVEESFAVEEDGEILAVVPLQFSPATRNLASSGWSGCGPILTRALSAKRRSEYIDVIIAHCDKIAKFYDAIAFEFSQPAVTAATLSNQYGVNQMQFHGFDDLSGITQVIDLRQSVDSLWRGLSKNARNIIRRAEKAGISVERRNWADSLESYYSLHCETYVRTGVTPHPRTYFEGIAQKTAPKGYSVLFAAIDTDNSTIAYHNDACFGPGVLYHTGCSANAAQHSGANYLLFWHAILAAKERGSKAYEVGLIFPVTSDPKQKGLTMFKTRFGGQPRRALRSRKKYTLPTEPEKFQTFNFKEHPIINRLYGLLKGNSVRR